LELLDVLSQGPRSVLMADPEGNEFCVCDSGAGSNVADAG
jgi:hypothetical protein